ncbi:MAG: hypothetical protein ACUVWO_14855 [Thermodesulfobacteriota bacterium]
MPQRRKHGRFHASRPNHSRHPKVYRVLCSGCGKEVVTPVPPPSDRRLLCMECFNRSEISKEER